MSATSDGNPLNALNGDPLIINTIILIIHDFSMHLATEKLVFADKKWFPKINKAETPVCPLNLPSTA